MDLFIRLINNVTLLIALAVLQSFIMTGIPPGSRLRALCTGLLFGATTVLVMTLSVPTLAGMEFNARSVVLSVAGLFGGPIAAGVTALMATAYRIHLGHPGVGMGIPVILTSAGLGVAGYLLRRSGQLTLNWKSLLLFGLLVQLCVLAWWLLLPEDTRGPVLAGMAIPTLLSFPAATVLLGQLLLLFERADLSLRQLEETRSWLLAAEANAHIGHWWLDPHTQKAYWADEIYRILDLEPSRPAGPETLQQCVHPADWDRLHASLRFALCEGGQHKQQYRIVRSDGEIRWVDCRGMAVRGKNGEVERVVGTFQDVTERVLAEQSARTAEQRLIKAQAVGQVGDWEYDLASGTIRASDEAFRIYGMAAPVSGQMSLAAMEACIVEQDRAHQALLDLIASGQPYHLEFAIRPQDQSAEIIIASKAELVVDDDGQPVRVVGVIQDITRRKAQENRVEAQKSFLEAILESTGEAIVACDREGKLSFFNRAAKALHHVNERPIGPAEWPAAYDLYMADGVTRMSPEQVPLLQAFQGRTIRELEMVIAPPEGEPRTVLATGAPVLDRHGNALGAVVSMHDITRRKQAEQALRQAHAHLEEQVAERTAELAKANQHLQELDRLKSLFIASMSHELRTPLSSIIGFTGMLLQEIPGPINDKQHDYLNRVAGSGRHLLALISDVIDIAKLEAGKAQAYIEPLDLGALVREAADQIRPMAESKGLSLQVDAPAGVVIASDRRRLLQCLLNYLSNALKYTPQGSITVRLTGPEPETGEVDIAVTDTGIGIAPADQARLFRQFSRIDSAITRRSPGTGLGLYLTRKLVTEVLGGRVSVSSRPGEGSTFCLHLPMDVRA